MKKKLLIFISILLVLAIAWGCVYYFTVKLPDMKKREQQLKEYNEFYAAEVLRYGNENKLYEALEVDVAFLGDSLTAGYDVASYYPEYLVLNRGIGGDTTHRLIERLDASVLDLQPKVCVMLIGGNNPETMFEDYEDILIALKENMPNTKVILVSHAPTSGPDWGKRNEIFTYNNVKVKLLAEKYGFEFVDLYSPMFDLEAGELKAEYTVDGAHFTAEGYRVVTDTIKPVIDKLLEEN